MGEMIDIYLSDYNYLELSKGIKENNKFRNSLVLYKREWNDHGYYTTFRMIYYSGAMHKKEIGTIKICHRQMKLGEEGSKRKVMTWLEREVEDQKLSKLTTDFCSVAQAITFYSNLELVLKRRHRGVLEYLREVSVLEKQELNVFMAIEVFKLSLLRKYGKNGEGKFLTDLTGFKYDLQDTRDTYTFFKELEQSFEKINKEKAFQEGFLRLVKNHVDIFPLAEKAVLYLTKYEQTGRENLLEKIKSQFTDQLDFIKKIDSLLKKNDELYKIIKKIKDQLLVTEEVFDAGQEKLVLGHYTSIRNIRYLISTEETYLRLTNSRQLNDPMEGKILLEYLLGGSTLDEFIPSHVYLASVTTELDSLPMWKQYTDDADGVVLEYDRSYLEDIITDPSIEIAKVCYFDVKKDGSIDIEGSKEMKELLEEMKIKIGENKNRQIVAALSHISLLFKKKEYSYENEYRIILDIEKSKVEREIILSEKADYPVPLLYTYLEDYPIRYSTILLGPKAMDIDYIGPYVKHCNKNIKIGNSKISFR